MYGIILKYYVFDGVYYPFCFPQDPKILFFIIFAARRDLRKKLQATFGKVCKL